jgi:hypothetical protein
VSGACQTACVWKSSFAGRQRSFPSLIRSRSAAEAYLDDTLSLTGPGNFIATDPPWHDRLRRVGRTRFTPTTVAAMEPAIRTDVRATLTAAVRPGGIDAAQTLARPDQRGKGVGGGRGASDVRPSTRGTNDDFVTSQWTNSSSTLRQRVSDAFQPACVWKSSFAGHHRQRREMPAMQAEIVVHLPERSVARAGGPASARSLR